MKHLMLAIAVILSLFDVSAKNQPKLDAELVKLIEENKQSELQDFLKKKKPSVDSKNAALRLAVEKNRVNIACMLINEGANPNVKDENGITPLMAIAAKNYQEIAYFLSIMNFGLATKGSVGLFLSIIKNDMKALHKLIHTKYIEVKEFLAEALCIALKLDHPEMAKILIDNRFKFIPKDGIARALIIAIEKGYLDVVKLLIEKGADVNAMVGECGHTVLMILANNKQRSEEDCLKSMKLLIEYGADVNARAGKHNQTALIEALKKKRFAIAKFLLKNGADVFVKDRKGNYAIFLLIKNAFKIMKVKIPKISKIL